MARNASDTAGFLSLERFQHLAEEQAHRLELVRGRVSREPKPVPLDARITLRIGHLLEKHAAAADAGPILAGCGFVLSSDPPTVRTPDLAFVSRARVPAEGYTGRFWHLAPDLAVEVLSPTSGPSETQEKVRDYRAAGGRLVWFVDPRLGTVTIHRRAGACTLLAGNDVLEGEAVLPGFRVALPEIFRL